MAKDPAFLFYPGDFMQGTQTFTREEKGAYMDLLILQFNEGHLSIDSIKRCLNGDFERIWPFLQKKFRTDADGFFFNERLEIEIEKRRKYSQSRRDNRKKKEESEHMNNISNTYVQHMENENENENVIENERKEGVQGKENVPRATVEDILSEESLASIFDEIFLDILRKNYSHLDVDEELRLFKVKVRGSPEEYQHRDRGGIRLAFQYQLKTSKGSKGTLTNGKQTDKGTQHLTSLVEGFKRRHGKPAS